MKGAVGVAGIAEIFLFLALLQDDDALAELRGAIGGDQARDAGPDHDHVVLGVRFGHRIRSRISIVAMLPLPLIGHHVSCRGQRCFELPPPLANDRGTVGYLCSVRTRRPGYSKLPTVTDETPPRTANHPRARWRGSTSGSVTMIKQIVG